MLQAKKKANLLYSRLLDYVRSGNAAAISAALAAPDFPGMWLLIVGHDLDFARTVLQFMSPQIARAAIEGGMGELDAAAVYLEYVELAKQAASSEELLALNLKMMIDYAERVAVLRTEAGEPSSPLLSPLLSPLTTQCRAYISEHVYDPLTTRDVAAALHVSRSHLSHIFKTDTGKTVGQYIRGEKATTAKMLLRHSTLGLAEIAQQLGFSSQSRFTEVFRLAVGVTPRQYRGGAGDDGRGGGEGRGGKAQN